MRLLRELQRGVKSGGAQGVPLAWTNSGDMSQVSCVTAAEACEHMGLIAAEVSWSGVTPVGTLQLQGSISGSSWFNVGSTVSVSGNTGTAYVTDAAPAYTYFRVLYTKTSGTGTLTQAYGQGKGF